MYIMVSQRTRRGDRCSDHWPSLFICSSIARLIKADVLSPCSSACFLTISCRSGSIRNTKKPQYDAEKIMKDLMLTVCESYEETGELKITAAEFALSPIKFRKQLITAQVKGLIQKVYTNEIFEEVY